MTAALRVAPRALPQRADLLRQPIRGLDLPQDLRLTDDQRVQAAGNAKQVTQRRFADVVIQVLASRALPGEQHIFQRAELGGQRS